MQEKQLKEEANRSHNRSTLLPGLRVARQKRGLTQRELASLAGTGAGTISDLEMGRRGAYPATMRRIADGLAIQVEDLLE